MTAPGVDSIPVELVVLAVVIGVLLVGLVFRARPSRKRLEPGVGGALHFVGGPLEGRRYELAADVTTVGSVPGNDIVVADPEVAKKHIGIRRDVGAKGWELADLGSPNGVFVNGQRMAKRLLASGDIIRLGTSEMVFRIEKVG